MKLFTCLACGNGGGMEVFLDLGMQPLANSYHDGSRDLPTYPLQVARCPECGHCQLTESVPPDDMFRDYAYVSGTSETLKAWFDQFARRAVADWRGRHENPWELGMIAPRVLDIGCNDGTLMESFEALGCEVVGIDPAANLHAVTKAKGLETYCGYWDRAWAGTLIPFDIICAFNVLAHTPTPMPFLKACVAALAPGGRLNVMTSQEYWLENGEFDYWYHEHVSGFTWRSLDRLAERAGLEFETVSEEPIHGGSMLVQYSAPYHDIAQRAAQTARDLSNALIELTVDGYTILGYGASAKGNTLLNYTFNNVDWIVDDNPGKWGLLTPGANTPVKAPSTIPADGKIAILLLAWNFADEIKRKVSAIRRDTETVYIYPFPQVRVER